MDSYETWAAANNITGPPAYETDGVPNLLRYALGGTAVTPAEEFLLVPVLTETGMSLSFNRVDDPSLTYEVWATDNLLGWGTEPIMELPGGGPVEVSVETDAPQLYLHLRVRRE